MSLNLPVLCRAFEPDLFATNAGSSPATSRNHGRARPRDPVRTRPCAATPSTAQPRPARAKPRHHATTLGCQCQDPARTGNAALRRALPRTSSTRTRNTWSSRPRRALTQPNRAAPPCCSALPHRSPVPLRDVAAACSLAKHPLRPQSDGHGHPWN